MKKKGVSTFKIGATYIGTIVGAGFASGQEVLQFFAAFGLKGLYGLILTTIMFVVFGYIIMDLGRKLHSHSHLEIIKYSGGKWIGMIIDFIITFFLFGALTAMIAGTGALFAQQFQIPEIWGNLLMAVLTAITVLTGIKGVINSISFVVPFLLASVIGISIFSIIQSPPVLSSAVQVTSGESELIRHWLLAAFLYTSYNTVISIAILGPLGVEAKNRKAIKYGAVIGGMGLGIGSIMIYLALSGDVYNLIDVEVPMVDIAGNISGTIQIIYAIVLIAEVYTTAVGSLFGFSSRVTKVNHTSMRKRLIIIGTTIVAFFASQFGFSNLVKYLYPLVGYGGMVLLISLLYSRFRYRYKKRR